MKIGLFHRFFGLLTLFTLVSCQPLKERWEITRIKYERFKEMKHNYEELVDRVQACEGRHLSELINEKEKATGDCNIALESKQFLQAQTKCLGDNKATRSPASEQNGIRGAISLIYSGSPQEALIILQKLPENDTRNFWISIAHLVVGSPEAARDSLGRFPAGVNP